MLPNTNPPSLFFTMTIYSEVGKDATATAIFPPYAPLLPGYNVTGEVFNTYIGNTNNIGGVFHVKWCRLCFSQPPNPDQPLTGDNNPAVDSHPCGHSVHLGLTRQCGQEGHQPRNPGNEIFRDFYLKKMH